MMSALKRASLRSCSASLPRFLSPTAPSQSRSLLTQTSQQNRHRLGLSKNTILDIVKRKRVA